MSTYSLKVEVVTQGVKLVQPKGGVIYCNKIHEVINSLYLQDIQNNKLLYHNSIGVGGQNSQRV